MQSLTLSQRSPEWRGRIHLIAILGGSTMALPDQRQLNDWSPDS